MKQIAEEIKVGDYIRNVADTAWFLVQGVHPKGENWLDISGKTIAYDSIEVYSSDYFYSVSTFDLARDATIIIKRV